MPPVPRHGPGQKPTAKVSQEPIYRLSRAAKLLGLSKRSILRAWRGGRVRLLRSGRGWLYIARSELLSAPLLTLGKAAKRVGLCYESLRRAAQKGRLKAVRRAVRVGDKTVWRGSSHVSLAEAARYARASRRAIPVSLRLEDHAG